MLRNNNHRDTENAGLHREELSAEFLSKANRAESIARSARLQKMAIDNEIHTRTPLYAFAYVASLHLAIAHLIAGAIPDVKAREHQRE